MYFLSEKVVSVGNLNIDLIGKLQTIPKSDEKTLLNEFGRYPGGGGANFAAASEKVGLDASFIGCVGEDVFGEKTIQDLQESGVDTSNVRKVEASTGFAFIFLTPKYERLLIEHRGANSYLEPSDMDKEYLKDAELVHASSVTSELAKDIGKKAESLNIKSSLDLGAELTEARKEELFNILKFFDICFMNGETFEDIFQKKPTEENILKQSPSHIENFVVTLGSKGAIVTDNEETFSSPRFEVEAKDTTGAGDVFAAVFDKYYLENTPLEKAIKYASAAAAIKIQHMGAREGLPSEEEIKKFVSSRT